MSTSEPKGKGKKPKVDNRERCLGEGHSWLVPGKRHTPHWWKNYTKWCDGKITG